MLSLPAVRGQADSVNAVSALLHHLAQALLQPGERGGFGGQYDKHECTAPGGEASS